MTEAKNRKPKGKNLTPKQKGEAIALWQAGEATYEELVKKFGKSKSTFQRLFKDSGIKHGEKKAETQAAVTAHVQQALTTDAALLAQRIKETKEEHYRISTAIGKSVGKLIMQAHANNQSVSLYINDFKALKLAADAAKVAREERFHCLGIADGEHQGEGEMEALPIHELTAEQIKAMAAARGDDDDGIELDDLAALGMVTAPAGEGDAS